MVGSAGDQSPARHGGDPDDLGVVLVDSDVFSFLWRHRPQADRYRPLLDGTRSALSFVTVGEAYFGADKAGWGPTLRAGLEDAISRYLVLTCDAEVARRWAHLKHAARSSGRPVADNDLWIAATAVRHAIPLLTHNRRHFEHLPGVRLLP